MNTGLHTFAVVAIAVLTLAGCGPREASVQPFEPEVPVAFDVRLPEMYDLDESYPLLVCLPDAGQTEQSVLDMWDNGYFYMPDFILVVVRQPFEYGAWFKEDPSEDPLVVRRRAARTGEELVGTVLADVESEYATDPDWRFICGFGQGAQVAFYAGFKHPELFQGAAGFGSGIDTTLISRRMLRGIRDMDIFATVPLDEELLGQAGAKVKIHEIAMGQTPPPSALRAMQNFFSLSEEEAPEDDVPYLMPELEPEDLTPPRLGRIAPPSQTA